MTDPPPSPSLLDRLKRPPWRTVVPLLSLLLIVGLGYIAWSPGEDVTDGRHDRGTNGVWLQHGWLGDDDWFERNQKTDRIDAFRNRERIRNLAALLREHHITDVFPHVAPTTTDGQISKINQGQASLFLDEFAGFRVMPWIGGAWGVQAFPEKPQWRAAFTESVRQLLEEHPRFAGVHINIEPCPTGNRDFILLLQEVRAVLEPGQVLSVAAYPPPTRWHPFPEVHWDEAYFREVASHADQIVVMLYDTALSNAKFYRSLMSRWAIESITWAEPTDVLLGLPAYDDADTDYHDPAVENLISALAGIHQGLLEVHPLPEHYRGIAIYSEWEMRSDEWDYLRRHFLDKNRQDVTP